MLHIIDCSENNFIDNYNTIQKELIKYGKNVSKKKQLIAISKSDLFAESKEKLSNLVEKKLRKKAYIFSSMSNDGIEDLVKALFKECEK